MDRRRSTEWALGLLALDVLLAAGLFARAWAHPSSVTAGARQDAPYTIWALAWVARAVTHGHSPWFTTALSWPSGVNLLTNATATGAGLVLLPVTLLAGPIVAYNVLATAGLAVTSWSAQIVLRRLPSRLVARCGRGGTGRGVRHDLAHADRRRPPARGVGVPTPADGCSARVV